MTNDVMVKEKRDKNKLGKKWDGGKNKCIFTLLEGANIREKNYKLYFKKQRWLAYNRVLTWSKFIGHYNNS